MKSQSERTHKAIKLGVVLQPPQFTPDTRTRRTTFKGGQNGAGKTGINRQPPTPQAK